jgi:hypothetical protein
MGHHLDAAIAAADVGTIQAILAWATVNRYPGMAEKAQTALGGG